MHRPCRLRHVDCKSPCFFPHPHATPHSLQCFPGCWNQIVSGRAYVAGLTEGFQTRLLSAQRMLLAVSRRWQLPDVDMVIEQDDL